jgi:dihydropteroate synthase
MARKRVEWKIKNELWRLGDRTLIAGVISVAPDSVFELGRYEDPDRAFLRALELADQGADIIEISADSLRPGNQRVAAAEELRRLVPVLKRLKDKVATPVCVETYKPEVAEKAIEYGATIIRDPSGLTLDQELAKVVLKHDVGFVLQHMRGAPETWSKLGGYPDPAGAVLAELTAAMSRAGRAGVEHIRMVADPGFGNGKRKEANSELLVQLDVFNQLHVPIAVSPSGQAFAAEIPVEPGPSVTIAAATMAVLRGAHIIRVHDVAAVRPAVLIADQALRD